MSNVVQFGAPRRGGKLIYAERILVEGRKRRQWAVVTRKADGSEDYHLCRGEKNALWLADVLRKAEAKRQEEREAMAANPFGQAILSIPPETRDLFRRMFEAEARLRD